MSFTCARRFGSVLVAVVAAGVIAAPAAAVAQDAEEVTFTKDVAPILQRRARCAIAPARSRRCRC